MSDRPELPKLPEPAKVMAGLWYPGMTTQCWWNADQMRAYALAAVEQLLEENFALAAGQCIVKGGLCSDDHGNQYCSLERRALSPEAARDALDAPAWLFRAWKPGRTSMWASVDPNDWRPEEGYDKWQSVMRWPLTEGAPELLHGVMHEWGAIDKAMQEKP